MDEFSICMYLNIAYSGHALKDIILLSKNSTPTRQYE